MDATPELKRLWTRDAFWEGAAAMLPLLPGLVAFGFAFGTVAARKGFSLFEACMMSATVYAGVAQIVVVESWPQQLTAGAVVAGAAVTALICSRFLLIGASMRPWLGGLPATKIYPMLYLLTEPPWLLSTRYYRNGGNDPAFVLGCCAITWFTWVLSTAPGYWLGAVIGDPQRFGLDLVMPAFFVAMLVSLWQGPRRAIGWVVGSAVALATAQLFGGFWYVVTGALAGSIMGGFIDD